jgi:hypothetical protein
VAALVDFKFIYEDGGGRTLEDEPRAVPSEPYEIVGEVALKGIVDGNTYVLLHHWIDGSPGQTVVSSGWGAEQEKWDFMPPSEVPVVTASNAFIFGFDLKNEMPSVQEAYGGPLREHSFEVNGCRS